MAILSTLEYFRVPPRWLFVKVTDADGNVGWGEATLESHSQAVEGTLDEMRDRLLGFEADNIEHIWQTVWRHGFYRGGPVFMSALAGLDIALWDLKSRRLGVPLHQLLGGAVRHKVRVYSWLGGDRPSDVAAMAAARHAQGFRAVKMNATADIGWLESPAAPTIVGLRDRVRAVREAGLDVALDFHGRVHRAMVGRLLREVEGDGVLFVEDPVLSEHPEAVKRVSGLTGMPIALGERLYSRWDFKRFFEDSSVDIIQPDVAHCGGISEMKRIAAMAEAYDVGIAPHCPIGPIALAACFQIALCTPNHVIQEMSVGIHYNVDAGEYDIHSFIKDPGVFAVQDGFVDALKGPGLGIEVNEAAVRKASKDAQPWYQPVKFYGPDGSVLEW